LPPKHQKGLNRRSQRYAEDGVSTPVTLKAQLDIATDGNGDAVLETFAADIITNGEISEAGLEYAQSQLNMNPDSVQEQFTSMQEHGGNVIYDVLETGDDTGEVRMDFLMDRYENGHPQEQEAIRSLWMGAALGRMDRAQIVKAFDKIAAPYDN
ncbi:MAG TPA: hypothetical protein DIU07_19820, partial [Rhodobacteraceae bacterium]|nr:hypothetical protein [Paracoccaceae bacterium]